MQGLIDGKLTMYVILQFDYILFLLVGIRITDGFCKFNFGFKLFFIVNMYFNYLPSEHNYEIF